jgi:hypothetical protein
METLKKNFEVVRPTSERAKTMVREEAERQFSERFGGSKVGSIWGKGIGIGIHEKTSVVIEVERPRASRRTRQQTANSE